MAWINPKINWSFGDSPSSDDFNRIENNSLELYDNKLSTTGGVITGDLQVNQYLIINAWEGYGTGQITFWADRRGSGVLDIDGANEIALNEHFVYHTGRKPSPYEIGAVESGTGTRKIVAGTSTTPPSNEPDGTIYFRYI